MINSDALAWLEQRRNRPFFVFLNYYDAHEPFQPPDGFDLHFGLSAQPWPSASRSCAATPGCASRRILPATPRPSSTKPSELLRDSYDNCIAYLDDQLGRLFAELDRRGLLDNTLVIVTSDHGEQFNEHHLFGHGNSLYGSLIHVPLLIFPPSGSPAGRIVGVPVSLRQPCGDDGRPFGA